MQERECNLQNGQCSGGVQRACTEPRRDDPINNGNELKVGGGGAADR